MRHKYSHLGVIAFLVETDFEDPKNVPAATLLACVKNRIRDLTILYLEGDEQWVKDAFSFYEEEDK